MKDGSKKESYVLLSNKRLSSVLAKILKTDEDNVPVMLKRRIKRDKAQLKSIPAKYKNVKAQRSVAYRVPLSDFLHVKKVLKQVPSIHNLLPTVQAFVGLARLKQFSASTKVAENMEQNLINDPASAPYLAKDLEHIGQMSKKDQQDMGRRLQTLVFNMFSHINSEQANKYLQKARHQLETYAKFARSSFFGKNGPKENSVTNELMDHNISEETLHEAIQLALLNALTLDESEQKKIQSLRENLSLPRTGYKVMSPLDYQNYLEGKFDSIIGFWGDARLYQQRTRDEIVHDFLRLDYPNTLHNAEKNKTTFAIQFDTSDLEEQLKEQIPFAFELMKPSPGYDPDNLPSNPFTGTGFTSSRSGELIPEFKATWKQRIPLKKGAKLGYFDQSGEFQVEYVYSGEEWHHIKDENIKKNSPGSNASHNQQNHLKNPSAWDKPTPQLLQPKEKKGKSSNSGKYTPEKI